MNGSIPFLVGIGPLPDFLMDAGSIVLSRYWGGSLAKHVCDESPKEVLNTLPRGNGLVQLVGDAAMLNVDCGSWLEALGYWRQPVILFSAPLKSGSVPGVSAAYVALCDSLSVPLAGIVQLGGPWDISSRRLDGLPWCGRISDNELDKSSSKNANASSYNLEIDSISIQLRKRIEILNAGK